jgi:hypothetical protein
VFVQVCHLLRVGGAVENKSQNASDRQYVIGGLISDFNIVELIIPVLVL